MARLQVQSPLENAAPVLQPTARPLNVNIGAAPAPRRSPLMELAESFRGFNGELQGLLRDTAAREDQDAMALGQLEATRTQAAQRMGEIESTLKTAADKGQISHARLPAFERGFRMRAGADLAAVFHERLQSKLEATAQLEDRLDPEKAISETYNEVAGSLHPTDFYGRIGFDEVAQSAINRFRVESAEKHRANFINAAHQKIADQGTEILYQLAQSPADQVESHRSEVKAHLDELRRSELPAGKVNEFYVAKVVAPAAEQLIAERKFDAARNLLHEMGNLDVTGKGGLLGKTEDGKRAFAALSDKLEREAREYDPYHELKLKQEGLHLAGVEDAAQTIQQLKGSNNGILPDEQRLSIVNAYRASHNKPEQALQVQAYEAAVNDSYELESKWRSNERVAADLETDIQTLDKTKLIQTKDKALSLFNQKAISPDTYFRITKLADERINKGIFIDEGDSRIMLRSLYSKDSSGLPGINFGGKSTTETASFENMWDKLPQSDRTEHQQRVTEFYVQRLTDLIGDVAKTPDEVKARKIVAIEKATAEAQDFAQRALVELTNRKARVEEHEKVVAQAAANKLGRTRAAISARLTDFSPKPPITADAARDIPKAAPALTPEFIKQYYAENSKPPAERDLVQVPLKARGWLQIFSGLTDHRIVSLSALAEQAKSEHDVPQTRDAKAAYGYAKSLLGFTPEEVKKGETMHGMPFVASQIDPVHIPVFRNKAELDKHWANGKPSETFQAVSAAVDPNGKLSPSEFYLAQAALLAHR